MKGGMWAVAVLLAAAQGVARAEEPDLKARVDGAPRAGERPLQAAPGEVETNDWSWADDDAPSQPERHAHQQRRMYLCCPVVRGAVVT